jgi:predicted dehydrogenase
MSDSRLSRRAFLAATTTTAALAMTATSKIRVNAARVVPKKFSPNDKLNIAAIGAGGKGMSDLMGCHALGENIVALCDVDWERAGEAFYKLPNAKQYKDFRIMLEEMPEIDAVTISTPDHTHAPAAFMAMNLGKHVYVQKPLTHTVAEARLLTNVAKETGVITQMGNQGNSGHGVRDLCEMIWAGAIGDVTKVHAWSNRPIWPQGIAAPLPGEPVPATLDWDLWIGPAPMREYNAKYAPFNWRGWWDFGCGALGDMACHIMDPCYRALKLNEAEYFTVESIQDGMTDECPPLSSVVKYSFPARAGMPPVEVFWYDGKIMPPRPDGIDGETKADGTKDVAKLGDGNNGSLFYGTGGMLTTGTYGGDSRLLPAEAMAAYTRPEPTIPRIENEDHYKDWIDGIKGGPKPGSSFDYSGPFTEMVVFGNLSVRTGKKLHWDNIKGKVTNDKKAAELITKEYRKGWELPC